MTDIFDDFDHAKFWDDDVYARQEYVGEFPDDDLIGSIEAELGYPLPASYVSLMKKHNGGIPMNRCFPTTERTSWAEDHVAISGIFGIGRTKSHSLCGEFGSQFWIDEWGYPEIGVCICDCPSAGHDMIMLDYRNPGEPQVVHVDQEDDYKVTFLATDFASFVRGLVNASTFDTSEDDFQKDLQKVDKGSFSEILASLVEHQTAWNFEQIIRNICRKITREKGYFSFHADNLSYLMYDVQFFLFTKKNRVASKAEYLATYPSMISFANADFSTGGYAPDYIDAWFTRRISEKQIVTKPLWGLTFTSDYEKALLRSLEQEFMK